VSDFFAFMILEKGQICGFHWTSRSQKRFSFRGLRPYPSDQWIDPWTLLGGCL